MGERVEILKKNPSFIISMSLSTDTVRHRVNCLASDKSMLLIYIYTAAYIPERVHTAVFIGYDL